MNRRLFGAFGALTVVAFGLGSCKSDPLSDLDGKPAALVTDFSFVEVTIGNSQTVTAKVLDARSAALPVPITFTACDNKITVAPDPDFHPVPATSARALITGQTFGTSCVVVQSEGFTDTVDVATFPVSIVVFTGPDTIVSGDSAGFTFEFRDAAGAPVAGVPAPTWSVDDTLKGKITAADGVLTARDTGTVTITVNGTGSPEGGVSGTKQVYIKPAPFTITMGPNPADPGQVVTLRRDPAGPIFDANTIVRFGTAAQTIVTGSLTPDSVKVAIPDLAVGGVLGVGVARLGAAQITQSGGALTVNTPAALAGSISPTSGIPGTTVTITRTSGPVFDANTRVYFNGIQSFVSSLAASTIVTALPGVGVKGPVELRLTRLDATDLARRVTFTADTAASLFADQYDDVNDDPATAPALTVNGDYYVVQHGTCTEGVNTSPGDDCDDFFKVSAPAGTGDSLTVNAAWFGGADVDILWCKNATCSGAGNVITGGGATSANPENSTVVIPAGATWYLWINYFEPAGASTLVRVRLTNKN